VDLIDLDLVTAVAETGGITHGAARARLSLPSASGRIAWAAEFGPRGIRVNAVSPGVIRDPAVFVATDHPAARMMAGTPAGRTGSPDDVAAAMVYLASDDAAFVHGAVLDVDGGRTEVAVIAG
jgi:NAD(P)-dependent dehydrogenase (short-subunit alcohol dehydrogenase family)